MSEPIDNEDKGAWCEKGMDAEKLFVGQVFGSGCAVFMNPAKAEDVYTHDLYMQTPSDLKTVRTPFRMAEDLYGIPSRFAVTLNVKDVERYGKKYPNLRVIFDIKFSEFGVKTVRVASMHEILRLIRGGKARVHPYKSRVEDQHGNAKDSYVIDYRWFEEIFVATQKP